MTIYRIVKKTSAFPLRWRTLDSITRKPSIGLITRNFAINWYLCPYVFLCIFFLYLILFLARSDYNLRFDPLVDVCRP